ncbi:MAG: metallophosphoesterase [Oscillospiraceae bacterium]|nr:metallophosphoesterase [Oscillospiraceae bacterium]
MNNSKVFFIADTHFGHEAIIHYENRPFQNVEEMDRIMIQNFNSVVSADDTVFILGDFSCYDMEKNIQIVESLNGRKILVMGNHDTETDRYYFECGFESVSRFPVIYEGFWILSHEPMYLNVNMPYANIYGHVHSNPVYADFSKQSYCVSAERINYTPIEFDEIINKISTL